MSRLALLIIILGVRASAALAGCDLTFTVKVPAQAQEHAPLVVVLHGCAQTGAQLAHDAEWNRLADRHGFYILFPDQPRCANPLGCFNWFDPAHNARGQGEVRAIKERVDRMKAQHGIDPSRVYVMGFSAGAAMGVALLASYPETFAAGSIMSGLPYRSANGSTEAWTTMSVGKDLTPAQWGALVRDAQSGFAGPYPRMAIFHGTKDTMVNPKNGRELVEQWTNLHDITTTPTSTETVSGHKRSLFKNAQGVPVVEHFEIKGLPHAIAVDPGQGAQQGGNAGQFAKDVDLYAPYWTVKFFGLAR